MRSVIELALQNVQEFKRNIFGVERVAQVIEFAENNPRLVAEIYLGYYQIIKDLVRVGLKDQEIVSAVNKKLEKENRVAKFQRILSGRGEDLVLLAAKAYDPESDTYKLGIEELTSMMRNADTIKTADPNAKPVDGDPKWDLVIWGYTNGAVDPLTDIHFVISHGLCRFISQEFKNELSNLTAAEKKDWLLNAMADIIALKGIQGLGREAKFYKQWREKRPMGLGWISDDRDNAYRVATSNE